MVAYFDNACPFILPFWRMPRYTTYSTTAGLVGAFQVSFISCAVAIAGEALRLAG